MKNSDAHNAHRTRRRANSATWPFIALSTIKWRAKRDGLDCTVTVADLKVPPVCPVLGIPLVAGTRCGSNSPSVDRVDNALGYTPENVQVISFRANQLKSDATAQELLAVLKYVMRHTPPAAWPV